MTSELPIESSSAVPGRPSLAERRRLIAQEAASHLSLADVRMAALVARVGAYRPNITRDPFRTLVGSIISQQVSMSAAASIQRKLVVMIPSRRATPQAILRLTRPRMRRAGLSRQKVEYIRGVAVAFDGGELSARALRRMDDENVIAALTQLKGIGRWTAEMLLIFCLERPDVWPVDDLGIRKAAGRFFDTAEMPTPKALHPLGDPFRPFRSYASWYLWRSLEGPLMPGTRV